MCFDDYSVKVCLQYCVAHTKAGNHKSESIITTLVKETFNDVSLYYSNHSAFFFNYYYYPLMVSQCFS